MSDRGPPKTPIDDDAFAEGLRDRLRASERQIDAETLARLRGARARAVAEAGRPAILRWPWRFAAPAAGFAAAALAGWLALTPMPPAVLPAVAPAQSAQIEMLELLGSEDAPLSEDDVDFVRWLDETHGDS